MKPEQDNVEVVSAGDALPDEMKVELNELLAKLWMCEKRDFISNRDAVFALFDRAVAASVQAQPQWVHAHDVPDNLAEKALSARVPGGSSVRDWFLPHDSEKAKENVLTAMKCALLAALPSPPVKEGA